ncbi:MAG: biopolymer transport protein ExbD [Pseudomonadota bacterium]|jgi:biopolymer transport protein ExbD
MNFRKPRFGTESHEPEINLIPFIDVLLVVLIFLMLTTSYSRFTELQVVLPVADAETAVKRPRELVVAVGADNRYALDRQPLDAPGVDGLVAALRQAAQGRSGNGEVIVVISADAAASHQAVINVMDAARRCGLNQITFATQKNAGR